MSSDWLYPLDMCASAGILDYDAAASLLDQTPRYVGNPRFEELPANLLPEGTKIKQSPTSDEFGNPHKNLVQNPGWKKWLFGGLTVAATAVGILALNKGKIKLPDMTKVKGLGTKILDFIKKPFVYIANKFKKS